MTAATTAEPETLLADVFQAGYDAGQIDGFTEGYAAGLEVGLDVGAARVMVALAAGWPDLSPLSPHYAEWRRVLDAGPQCPRRCGRCSACVRLDAVARHGGDHPGGPVAW